MLGLGFLMEPRSIVNRTLHECREGLWTVLSMALAFLIYPTGHEK